MECMHFLSSMTGEDSRPGGMPWATYPSSTFQQPGWGAVGGVFTTHFQRDDATY